MPGTVLSTLADIITNPGAMTKLKELRKLSPRSEKAINIVGTVLLGVGLELGQDQVGPPPDSSCTSLKSYVPVDPVHRTSGG